MAEVRRRPPPAAPAPRHSRQPDSRLPRPDRLIQGQKSMAGWQSKAGTATGSCADSVLTRTWLVLCLTVVVDRRLKRLEFTNMTTDQPATRLECCW